MLHLTYLVRKFQMFKDRTYTVITRAATHYTLLQLFLGSRVVRCNLILKRHFSMRHLLILKPVILDAVINSKPENGF